MNIIKTVGLALALCLAHTNVTGISPAQKEALKSTAAFCLGAGISVPCINIITNQTSSSNGYCNIAKNAVKENWALILGSMGAFGITTYFDAPTEIKILACLAIPELSVILKEIIKNEGYAFETHLRKSIAMGVCGLGTLYAAKALKLANPHIKWAWLPF